MESIGSGISKIYGQGAGSGSEDAARELTQTATSTSGGTAHDTMRASGFTSGASASGLQSVTPFSSLPHHLESAAAPAGADGGSATMTVHALHGKRKSEKQEVEDDAPIASGSERAADEVADSASKRARVDDKSSTVAVAASGTGESPGFSTKVDEVLSRNAALIDQVSTAQAEINENIGRLRSGQVEGADRQALINRNRELTGVLTTATAMNASLYNEAKTHGDLLHLMNRFYEGSMPGTSRFGGFLAPETQHIVPNLKALNQQGFLTWYSQPSNCEVATDVQGVSRRQFAYLHLSGEPQATQRLKTAVEQHNRTAAPQDKIDLISPGQRKFVATYLASAEKKEDLDSYLKKHDHKQVEYESVGGKEHAKIYDLFRNDGNDFLRQMQDSHPNVKEITREHEYLILTSRNSTQPTAMFDALVSGLTAQSASSSSSMDHQT